MSKKKHPPTTPHAPTTPHRKARTMDQIVIVHHASHPGLTGEVMRQITHALARQAAEHVGPLWRIVPPALSYDPDGYVPDGASALALFDNADQAGALGYHGRDPHGIPYGRVFVETILANGGTLFESANSVAVTLSHELLEMLGDEDVNVWCDAEDGYEYARELCDAVEADAYVIDGVHVSNFVLPTFFDPSAPHNITRFDYRSRLGAPFTMLPGGYQIRRGADGRVENVWGDMFPEWKRAAKAHPASRTSRRAASAPHAAE